MARLGLALSLAAALACAPAQPCANPLSACDGHCVLFSADVANCGGCGRACSAGFACVEGKCVQASQAPCATRSGGWFVILDVCGETVKMWTVNPTFAQRAIELATNPAAPGNLVPDLPLVDGSDCDAQWSWHPDPVAAEFTGAADPTCDACPADVEQNPTAYVGGLPKHWCPGSDRTRVIAVDAR
jgi:hypothetical protein